MSEIKENVFDIMYEPLAGSSLTNLLRLASQNRFRISPRYIPRFLYAMVLSTVLSPFRLKEHIKESDNIQSATIQNDPVFIIGHWRSGTTYLHNVLSLDQKFGYCTTFHATLPHVFLQSEELLKPLLSASIPTKRPMDNAAMGPDLPQEEEYAIANIIPDGYYNGWCFPYNMNRYMTHVLVNELSDAFQKNWIKTYDFFVKKLTLYHHGKQLLLKNPAHTARLLVLKQMYPNAKFIHIHRNPYEIYYSMEKFMRIVLPRYCLQRPPSTEKMKQQIFRMYALLYQSYFKQKSQIPTKDLIEIPYESFIKNPLDYVKNIYNQFDFSLNEEIRKNIQDYIDKQKNFKRSKYQMSKQLKQEIYNQWEFAFNIFQYSK
ncbi:MAG: sulfotransferase [Candidatus Thermoplasmatota archaeon]|nr:sulfotransferase [Candidatus Thermoplasmatota archaeon]